MFNKIQSHRMCILHLFFGLHVILLRCIHNETYTPESSLPTVIISPIVKVKLPWTVPATYCLSFALFTLFGNKIP